jgi:3-oxoacyl-[acyl-carrier-protein] synthase II
MKAGEPIVITGIGPVTPVGVGLEDFWQGLVKGRSGARLLSGPEFDDLRVRIAAPVDVDVSAFLEPEVARRMDRTSHLAVIAAELARADSGLGRGDVDDTRMGVVVGSGIGGWATLANGLQGMFERGPLRARPEIIGLGIANAAAGAVGQQQGARGPTECVATACATGGHAVARAVSLLHAGYADAVLTGGTEAVITRSGLAAFAAARTLSARHDAPELASRPFDVGRDGFLLAEGATVLVLERESDARARGARIYAKVTGIGLSGDAYHYMAPEPEGAGAELAMRNAIRDADLEPGDLTHVNAHATSTPSGDRAEASALLRVFDGSPPPVYAPKSALGHLLGGAGTTEIAASALALSTGVLPGTLNLDQQDDACALPVATTTQDIGAGGHAISNSFGFGGTNVTVALSAA